MALRAAISRRVVNRPSWLYGTRSISQFVQDPTPNTLNPLGLGACGGNYRKSEFAVNLNTQYLFLGGNANTIGESKFALGDSSDGIKETSDAAIQALSGAAACHHLVDFHKRLYPDMKTVVCEDEKQTASVKSQLQQLVRPMYRNPSVYGPLLGPTVGGKSFSLANIRTTHSQAGVTSGNGEFSAKLRPLSPHLTVYKPQSTSTSSIFHRIAYIYMGVAALFYYLLYLKMGMICFTYEKFYQFFYYSSELFPIINKISFVALAYYLYKGAEQFIKFR